MKLASISIVLSSILCSLVAHADTAIFSGMECQKDSTLADGAGSVAYVAHYSATGAANMSKTESMRVICPLSYTRRPSDLSTDINLVPNAFGNTILVNVRDYSSTSSVSCEMGGLSTGGVYYGPSRHTCGLFGNCDTDSVPSYMTPYSVYSSPVLVVALNGTNWISAYISCRLPPAPNYGINGVSVIQSYRMTYNPD